MFLQSKKVPLTSRAIISVRDQWGSHWLTVRLPWGSASGVSYKFRVCIVFFFSHSNFLVAMKKIKKGQLICLYPVVARDSATYKSPFGSTYLMELKTVNGFAFRSLIGYLLFLWNSDAVCLFEMYSDCRHTQYVWLSYWYIAATFRIQKSRHLWAFQNMVASSIIWASLQTNLTSVKYQTLRMTRCQNLIFRLQANSRFPNVFSAVPLSPVSAFLSQFLLSQVICCELTSEGALGHVWIASNQNHQGGRWNFGAVREALWPRLCYIQPLTGVESLNYSFSVFQCRQ